MNRDELFALADYIVAHYGDAVTVVRFLYDAEDSTYSLLLRMPDGTDEPIHARSEFEETYEPELAAWQDWMERHATAPPPPAPGA